MKEYTRQEIKNLKSKEFANKRDILIGSVDIGFYGRDSDTCDGMTGVAWYEVFKERNTDIIYKVYCTDNANGGRGPYSREHEYAAPKFAGFGTFRNLFIKGIKNA